MPKGFWTEQEKARLRQLYPGHRLRQVASIIGRSYTSVRSTVGRLGFSSRTRWTSAERVHLRALYPNHSSREIAQKLGRTYSSVSGMARKLGLEKSQEYLRRFCRLQKGSEIGKQFRFKKGQEPANKGLRRPGYSIGRGRMRETQFKKGQKSWRTMAVGAVHVFLDGYLRVKTREPLYTSEPYHKIWKLLHHQIWIEHHGPIPPKTLVAFKDGNRMNCAIENLELRTMRENVLRNSMWNTDRIPRELAEAMHANGQLKRRLRNLDGKK